MPPATEAAPVKKVKNGTPCTISDPVPAGMYRQPMSNGTYEFWQLKPEGFNPHQRADILKDVDKTFAAVKPTKEFPNRPRPVALHVNKAWRALFRNVQNWSEVKYWVAEGNGDLSEQVGECPVFGAEDAAFKDENGKPDSAPRFKFVDEEGRTLTGNDKPK